MSRFAPAVIPVPSYLYGDIELQEVMDRLADVVAESDSPCPRADACVQAIRMELAKRDKPVAPDPARCPVVAARPFLTMDPETGMETPAMKHDPTDVYVTLSGSWPAPAVQAVQAAVDAFFEDLDHDGLGENSLSRDGTAHAYYCDPLFEVPLALREALDTGPAWRVAVERADDPDCTLVFVSGPGTDGIVTLHGTLEDPLLKRSEWTDPTIRARTDAALAAAALPFTLRA